jgi:hypothetical protein
MARSTGIRARHSRSCPVARDKAATCRCHPSYGAFVYSARDGRKLRRTFSNLSEARGWRHDATSAVRKRTKVPVYAILTQTLLSSLFVIAIFNPWVSGDNNQKAYWLFQAAVTVIWCISMVLLFADIFLVKRAFPEKFEEVRAAHPYLLYASGVIGMLASAFGAYVVFRSPWTGLFSVGHWRIWLGTLCGVSVLAAVLIYAISEYVHRREAPTPTPTPA